MTLSAATYRVIRMKNVGSRRVVDDDDFVKLAAESAQVFDVVAAVEDAGLAEQPRVKHVPLVQEVRHWIGVLEKIGWNFNDKMTQPSK